MTRGEFIGRCGRMWDHLEADGGQMTHAFVVLTRDSRSGGSSRFMAVREGELIDSPAEAAALLPLMGAPVTELVGIDVEMLVDTLAGVPKQRVS